MGGSVSEDNGAVRSTEAISNSQRCQSADSLAEWRSCEQVENGTPSTSPPYWDTDDDDDCGPKPSELYGKFTWKIENFSQISKRELRSNAFEVGGYKWYILVYPQGCDVCNHLSLFLCVANHDKLLPGWSHFAQFTIAVVNKDPKKSKYSDTLHRFWKKEHDWGWKKFMELSKVLDGFIVADTLVIKAQVQVIREKSHRPFRCLDCLYRRELVRVYLTNVEGICRRFVEERRGKLVKLLEDEKRWASFRVFWLGVDQNTRRRMSREKTDAILKVVVKHFFIEKEVTSTLVMDSLYSGLKALECQSKNKKGREKIAELEETPDPIIHVEKDMFVLADDILLLLDRAALEPLPPSKDDKGPQNRTKDGSSGEDFNKDSIERDERRLTELGRRTVEIFVLAHIFSNRIEVAYQEAVALKRQEELIREEEAAWQAGNELRAKRGAADKEKRTKKKQNKQKKNSRKGKDRGRDEKFDVSMQEKHQQESPSGESTLEDFSTRTSRSVLEKPDSVQDVSDVSDTADGDAEARPDVEDTVGGTSNWDTDTSGILPAADSSRTVQNGHIDKKGTSVMDDSSSTCSTDSVPSVVMNDTYKGNSLPDFKNQTSPSRGKNQHGKCKLGRTGWVNDIDNRTSDPVADASHALDASSSSRAAGPQPEAVVLSLKDRIQWLEQHLVEKEEEVVSLQRKLCVKDKVIDLVRPSKHGATESSSSLESPSNHQSSDSKPKQMLENIGSAAEPVPARETSSNSPSEKTIPPITRPSPQLSPSTSTAKPETQKSLTPTKPASISTEKPAATAHQLSVLSRPSSAPLTPGPRPTTPSFSMVQTSVLLARSASAAGRLGTDSSLATSSISHGLPITQSYRNAIMGKSVAPSPAGFMPRPPSNSPNPSPTYSQAPSSSLPLSTVLLQGPATKNQIPVGSGSGSGSGSASGLGSGSVFTFGTVTPEILKPNPWVDESYLVNDMQGLDIYGASIGPRVGFTDEVASGTSSRQTQGMLPDEFPHLDIINSLFDEEHNMGKAKAVNAILRHPGIGPHLNRQFTFPGDVGMADMLDSSVNCCRFDKSAKYHEEGIRHVYGPTGATSFHGLRENQAGLSGYMLRADEQTNGMIHSQWPMGPADLSLLSMENAEANGYLYQLPEYSNLTCGLNGYAVYRPANGH